ncbi:MAG TPA: ribosomal protein L13e [Terriglobales bacterium]|nr:ribosomal protein L13e [Terriglobales bacterium]
MDKQDLRGLLHRLKRRFDRSTPEALYVYGRRAVPAAGFSMNELFEAGISAQEAELLGLRVDAQRMSSLGTNVEALRDFLARR